MSQIIDADESQEEKPCPIDTGRGFSLSYRGRLLYSKYAPDRAICGAINDLNLLPGSLILALSPALWHGLKELIQKMPEKCFILGIEADKNLYELEKNQLKEITDQNPDYLSKVTLLKPEEIPYIVNILTGQKKTDKSSLPDISSFKRAIPLEMSGGSHFYLEEYRQTAALSQNTIASFWKNRITLTKFGRLYSRNLFKNLGRLQNSSKIDSLYKKISMPILILGAGESIDSSLSLLKKECPDFEKKVFILCVDAALPALKERGIKADALCAVEGQLAIEKAYIGATAKESMIFADICSRPEVTSHGGKGVYYFASEYSPSIFLKNLSEKSFFPHLIPPLGSVGLAAVYLALALRENQNIPVIVSGLDFSFSLGKTHAKNTPQHISRLISSDRLHPLENYAAAFREGAVKVTGKDGRPVYTDTGLSGYGKSFTDMFAGSPNLYDCGQSGLNLGLPLLSPQKVCAYINTLAPVKKDFISSLCKDKGEKDSEKKLEIKKFLEEEEKVLNRIKELLMFGQDVASCSMSLQEELKSLIEPREYLYLHFPDGYLCHTENLSFLKRIRGQIDFFLKDVRGGIREER